MRVGDKDVTQAEWAATRYRIVVQRTIDAAVWVGAIRELEIENYADDPAAAAAGAETRRLEMYDPNRKVPAPWSDGNLDGVTILDKRNAPHTVLATVRGIGLIVERDSTKERYLVAFAAMDEPLKMVGM